MSQSNSGMGELPSFLCAPPVPSEKERELRDLEDHYQRMQTHFRQLSTFEANLQRDVQQAEDKKLQLGATHKAAVEANVMRRSQIHLHKKDLCNTQQMLRRMQERIAVQKKLNEEELERLNERVKRHREAEAALEEHNKKVDMMKTHMPWVKALADTKALVEQKKQKLHEILQLKAELEKRRAAAEKEVALHREFPALPFFLMVARTLLKLTDLKSNIVAVTAEIERLQAVRGESLSQWNASEESMPSHTCNPQSQISQKSVLANPICSDNNVSGMSEQPQEFEVASPSRFQKSPQHQQKTPTKRAMTMHEPPKADAPVPKSALKKKGDGETPGQQTLLSTPEGEKAKLRVRIAVQEEQCEETMEEEPRQIVIDNSEQGEDDVQSDFEACSDEPVNEEADEDMAMLEDEDKNVNETVDENAHGDAALFQKTSHAPINEVEGVEDVEMEDQEPEAELLDDEAVATQGEEGEEFAHEGDEPPTEESELLSVSQMASHVADQQQQPEEQSTMEEPEDEADFFGLASATPKLQQQKQSHVLGKAPPMEKRAMPSDPAAAVLDISVNSSDPGGDFLALMQGGGGVNTVANVSQVSEVNFNFGPSGDAGGGATGDDFLSMFGGAGTGAGEGGAMAEAGGFDFNFGDFGAGGGGAGDAGASFNFSFGFPN